MQTLLSCLRNLLPQRVTPREAMGSFIPPRIALQQELKPWSVRGDPLKLWKPKMPWKCWTCRSACNRQNQTKQNTCVIFEMPKNRSSLCNHEDLISLKMMHPKTIRLYVLEL